MRICSSKSKVNLNNKSTILRSVFVPRDIFLKLQVVPRFTGTGTCISPVPILELGYLNPSTDWSHRRPTNFLKAIYALIAFFLFICWHLWFWLYIRKGENFKILPIKSTIKSTSSLLFTKTNYTIRKIANKYI
jgi:hypothetical protein